MDLGWPLPHRTDLRDALLEAYGEERRGYHGLTHLAEVLAHVDELGGDEATVLAAWYHDAVYDHLGDNEERSADLAATHLAGEDVDVAEVVRLVRLTETHRPAPGDARGEVLCDADLAVLAAGAERYAAYTAGVRREYAAVPEDAFRAGRAAVLRDLLAKPTLFHTAHAREHWEAAARRNVEDEIRRLEGR